MKTKLFWAIGLVLLVVGAWVLADETPFDAEYGTRAAALKPDDARAHYDLAKWAIKKGLYREASAEADKLLALDSGDLRAKYLKQEVDTYSGGSAAPAAPTQATTAVAPTSAVATSAAVASSAVAGSAVAASAVPAQTPPPAVAAGPMTKDEVDKLYKTYDKHMKEFTATVQPLLIAKCGNDNCHGNSSLGGAFHLKNKTLADRTTIAENFRAVEAYVDHDALASSKLLFMALAKKDKHKSDSAPIFGSENDPAYKVLKAFIMKFPSGADLRWGTSH